MYKFMIGQFDRFNEEKQQRDFRPDFYGVEACLLSCESDVNSLVSDSRRNHYKIGVHFPLRAGQWKLRDPQYMSKDKDIKQQSYHYIKEELEYIKDLGVDYVLFHFPKPVLLDPKVNWSYWRFADKSEYCTDDEYSYEEFLCQSKEFFHWINEMSLNYGITPVLEFDALNKYVCENRVIDDLLEKYPRVKVCLDIARLHLQDMTDPNFNALDIIKRFAKYTEVVHLSNVRFMDNVENNHYPALRTLNPHEGWADVSKYLQIIKRENDSFKILFEHRSELISDEQLEDCYQWIMELLS